MVRGAKPAMHIAEAPNESGKDFRTGEQRESDAAKLAAAQPPPQASVWQQTRQGILDRLVVTPTEIGQVTGKLAKAGAAPHEAIADASQTIAREGIELAGAFTRLSNPATSLAERFKDLGKEAIEAKRNFAELNGVHARGFAQLDINRFRNEIATARDTAGPTHELIQAQIRLENILQPMAVNVEILKTQILTRLVVGSEIAVKHGEEVVRWLPGIGFALDLINDPIKEKMPIAKDTGTAGPSEQLRAAAAAFAAKASRSIDPLRPPLPYGPKPMRGDK
jgi:hypothetical protein